ncbi:unnamed protein product, partial [Effrenium voratum]
MAEVTMFATLPVAFFVAKWLISWWSMASNSWQVAKGLADVDGIDVAYAGPLAVLVMGLFMTNLQGYFQEKRQEPDLARAAMVDMDLPFLLWQKGREICSEKPPQAWRRLKLRQALGRGIPMSMVSFFLASRHVVEAPTCQLSTTFSRPLLQKAFGQNGTELEELLTSQEEICSVPLPFGLGCKSRQELDQDRLVASLQNGSNSILPREFSQPMRQANEAVWKAAHCDLSMWRALPTEDDSFCGYEFCLESNPPEGPMKALNRLVNLALIEKLTRNDQAERDVKLFLA